MEGAENKNGEHVESEGPFVENTPTAKKNSVSQGTDGSAVREIMTPEHPQWIKFEMVLGGPEGCNFRKGKEGGLWVCGHGIEKPLTKAILKKYFPQVDIAGSLAFFESHDGYCDCEIFINVGDIYNFSKKRDAEKPGLMKKSDSGNIA